MCTVDRKKKIKNKNDEKKVAWRMQGIKRSNKDLCESEKATEIDI
jgi:hypothetical protein